MADRIIPRRDTLARWAEVNPTLLEGEWGIVTDNLSLYKIGDGVTAWNDLPFRGFNGNIVQEMGDSAECVMSQASVTEQLNTKASQNALAEAVEPLARQDGNYPQMSVGFAENIVGDGTATEEEFSFRPTAGVNRNVETTSYDYDMRSNFAARIESVKGNSVVWNNQIGNISLTSTSYALPYGEIIKDNRYLIDFTSSDGKFLYLYTKISGTSTNIRFSAHSIFTSTFTGKGNGTNDDGSLWVYAAGSVSGVRLYDLTKMFGAGNEPTTIEEFYSLLPKNVDLNAYNEGEIVDANYKAIKTTGLNQYNGTFAKVVGGCPYYLGNGVSSAGFTTEEGGTTEAIEIPTNRLYTPSQNGYIYAEGSDICINIAWDEYSQMNGTYSPYKPFERDLSWVAQYFPEGMRRAGSAHDEIRFNATTQKWEAVQRVGVVDLGSLSWSAMGSGTSGIWVMRASFNLHALANNVISNITTERYTPATGDNVYVLRTDKTIAGAYNANGNYISVYDSDYTTAADVAAFTTSLSGVMLNYELATPIVTEIEEIPNLDFDVADYGTEELIAPEGVKSAPFHADIIYTPNALKTLEQVPDILRRLTALENA